jgi:hypothetical protein
MIISLFGKLIFKTVFSPDSFLEGSIDTYVIKINV